MIVKCCNPVCDAPFDYQEGRLIRVSTKTNSEKSPESHVLIQHFWLCGKCAGLYVFESRSGAEISIKPRQQELSKESRPCFVSAA